jgi:hypothetical protein
VFAPLIARSSTLALTNRTAVNRHPMAKLAVAGAIGCTIASFYAPPAAAQAAESIIVTPVLPLGYDAYLEHSVSQQGDGEWAAVGVPVESFVLFPEVTVGQSVTTNTYSSGANAKASAIEILSPKLVARSDWSRHALVLNASGTFKRFVGQSRRNEDVWDLSATSDLDVTGELRLEFIARASQLALNRFSGEVQLDAASVVTIRQDQLSASATYRSGHARSVVTAEYFNFRYGQLLLTDGTTRDQSNLNHDAKRLTGQFEYSFTPDLTLFTQATYADFSFDSVIIPTTQNASSSGTRVIAGGILSIAGLGRATVSAGYAWRDYDRNGLKSVSGPSAEARLEFFPSPLTTVTIDLGRRLADARLIDSSAFNMTYVKLRLDHALLRNLKLAAEGNVARQSYLNSQQVSRIQNALFSATYLASRRFELSGAISYSTRRSTPVSANSHVDELVGGVAATFKL